MHKSTWKSLVDLHWDDAMDSDEKEVVVKEITGHGSHFYMNNYSKPMRERIRDKLVELDIVRSLEETK